MSLRSSKDLIELIAKLDVKTIILNGYNEAIIGYDMSGSVTRCVYSVNKIVKIIQEREEWDFIRASQFFEVKIQGKKTKEKGEIISPVFVYEFRDDNYV